MKNDVFVQEVTLSERGAPSRRWRMICLRSSVVSQGRRAGIILSQLEQSSANSAVSCHQATARAAVSRDELSMKPLHR
jgi:hypothetical protein